MSLLVCVRGGSSLTRSVFVITSTSQLAYDLHLYEALDALNLQFGILMLKFCPYSTRCDFPHLRLFRRYHVPSLLPSLFLSCSSRRVRSRQ